MDFELQAVSDAGRAFVSLCERHGTEFFSRATQHDQEGSFPTENIADLVGSGVTAATVPADLSRAPANGRWNGLFA